MANIQDEYNAEHGGGIWYYKQDKPGTEWFDHADNEKGWTLDFNLKVEDVNDSKDRLFEDDLDGAGIYVNDGTAQESITFLQQEIIFQNANQKIIYDTSEDRDYRLLGKGDGLQLFSRETGNTSVPYDLIAESPFKDVSTDEANAHRPSIVEDINGDYHAVWSDDSNKLGQVLYSTFSEGEWSPPELISDKAYGALSPVVIVDNDINVYVAYEYLDRSDSSIALQYKNELGWSDVYTVGTDTGRARKPEITFDSQYNVILVWQDSRFVNPEIYLNKFTVETLSVGVDVRVTSNSYIISNPSVSSYFDDIFITWTKREVNNSQSIQIIKYQSLTGRFSDPVSLGTTGGLSDFSNVLVNSSGEVIVVWSDTVSGRKDIYSSVLNLDLDIITSLYQVTSSAQTNGGCSFPVLSEQSSTGNVYIIWQDYLTDYSEFVDVDPSDVQSRKIPQFFMLFTEAKTSILAEAEIVTRR
jgi:hypothetical protein